MKQKTTELVVGLFMIAGFAALLVLAMQVSGLSLKTNEATYTVYANFNDVSGLSVRGQVSMAGVTIGRVSRISLDPQTLQARVELEIRNSMNQIPTDSSAIIRTSGLLGEKYIDISVGADETAMRHGDTFYETQSSLNLERMISNFASGMGR